MSKRTYLNDTGVYRIINTTNGKFYVGSTARGFRHRWDRHKDALRRNTHPNAHLQGAWNKDGGLVFLFTVLERCSVEECIKREQYWIDRLGSTNRKIGYNLLKRAGSSLGLKHSAETREKMSRIRVEKCKDPAERERLSVVAREGMNRPEVKEKMSSIVKKRYEDPEYRARHSEIRKGKKQSPETVEKRRLANTGQKRTAEFCARLAAANRGKKRTEEQKLKMSLAAKKRWDDPEQRRLAAKKTRNYIQLRKAE